MVVGYRILSVSHQPAAVDEMTTTEGIDGNTDEQFRALVSPRRRCLVAQLCERPETHSLEDLVPGVVRWELDGDPETIDEETKQSVLISLYHVHAPMLADAGLAVFDPEECTIAISDIGAELEGRELLPTIE